MRMLRADTEKKLSFLICVLYYAGIAGAAYFFLRRILPLILPFLIGFAVAVAVDGAIKKLTVRIGRNKRVIAVIFTVAVWGLVVLAACIAANLLYTAFISLAGKILAADAEKSVMDFILGLPRLDAEASAGICRIASQITQTLSGWANQLLVEAARFVLRLPSAVMFSIAAVISSVMFSSDMDNIKAYIIGLVPMRHRQNAVSNIKKAAAGAKRILRGYSVIFILIFVLTAAGLSVIGTENAFVIAAAVAVFDILPVFGSAMILVPWSAVLIIKGSLWQGLALAILVAVTEILRQTLEPRLIGNHLGLHPAATFMGIYAGTKLFGVYGAICVPPALLAAKYIIKIYIQRGNTDVPTNNTTANPCKSA